MTSSELERDGNLADLLDIYRAAVYTAVVAHGPIVILPSTLALSRDGRLDCPYRGRGGGRLTIDADLLPK